MILKDLLSEKEISKFLEEFKKIFGGLFFIIDNVGGQIGQGCTKAGGVDVCSQCPKVEFQITRPIEVERVTLGSLIFCPSTEKGKARAEVNEEILRVMADMIAWLSKAERDAASLAEEVNANYEILNLLYGIGETIATTFELEEVCGSILKQAGDIVGAASGCMMIRETKGLGVNLATSYGVEERLVKGLELRPGQGIVSKVLSEGRAELIGKLDPSLPLAKIESLFPPPLLAAPMKSERGIVGLIILARKDGGKEFTSGDLKLVQAIAIQAGSAMKNISLFKDLKSFFLNTVKALSSTIDARDPYTVGHSERVAEYSLVIAEEMNLDDKERESLQLTAYLHDIGMIIIPEEVIHHPEELTEDDFKIVKQHPVQGVEIIRQIEQFEKILPGIWHHHEHYNGGGYPAGLAKEDIPLSGRIIAVADAFDAMISERSYRKALSIKASLVELEENSGHQFDPQVILAFRAAYDKDKINKDMPESEKKTY